MRNSNHYDDKFRSLLIKALEHQIEDMGAEIKRLRYALQQVWDCEEYNSCPDCKLLAREALEGE